MIVVDTNILVDFKISTENTSLIEKVFQCDSQWETPLVWKSEFRNVLAVRLRNNRINFIDAIRVLRETEQLLKGHEHIVPSELVLNLAYESGCSAYDCEFVALAHQVGIPLVTQDKQILKAFPQTAVSAQEFIKR